jgi:hypothetical protein
VNILFRGRETTTDDPEYKAWYADITSKIPPYDYEPEFNPPWVVRRMTEASLAGSPSFRGWYFEGLEQAAAVCNMTLDEYLFWLDELHEQSCQRWLENIGGVRT